MRRKKKKKEWRNVIMAKVIEDKKKKVLSENERPDMEHVLLRCWALLHSCHQVVQETSGVMESIKSGLLLLSCDVIKEFQLAHYGYEFWEEIE
jgi:hypothetical protein